MFGYLKKFIYLCNIIAYNYEFTFVTVPEC